LVSTFMVFGFKVTDAQSYKGFMFLAIYFWLFYF